MSPAQIEHADIFTPPLPERDTFDRLEELFIDRRRERVLANTRRFQLRTFDQICADPEMQASDHRSRLVNQMTQAEMRLAEVELEIIERARLLVAEADAETLEETL